MRQSAAVEAFELEEEASMVQRKHFRTIKVFKKEATCYGFSSQYPGKNCKEKMSGDRAVPPEVSIDAIRHAAISRRGGIRVRGGRLPPIRIRNLPQVGNAKKTVAPNIPQRRVKVKEEILDYSDLVKTKQVDTKGQRDSRERGRGRGSKCIVQTEGTFLGQGPAARVKKELADTEYERVPRSSRAAGNKQSTITFDRKLDEKDLKYLLEPWDENENFDDNEELYPVTLPLKLKSEFKCKIKKEPLDDVDIKKEAKDGDIKDEPAADKWRALEGKFFASISPGEDMKKENLIDLVDSTKVTGDSILLLFQMPQSLPFGNTDCPEKEHPTATPKATTSQANEQQEIQDVKPKTLFDGMSDGCIGKLQVLKSGKMRLVIGSFMFILETGSDSESLMKAVSIRTQDENGGDIVVLGNIERSMIVSPSDDLFTLASTVAS